MTVPQDKMTIETAALEWIIRQRDPAFEDWDAFTLWLEVDPVHADIYHAMAAADADMAPLIEQTTAFEQATAVTLAANDDDARPGWLKRRAWIGGALAASLVAMVGIGLLVPRSDPWSVETRPGERRSVALADGSRIVLNGATRVTLDRAAPRRAVLDHGEAMFIVRHDESDPFEVSAGTARLVDIGTAFNVVRDGGSLDVAVSEGAVLYNPTGEAARIDAGRRLHATDGDGHYILSRIDSAQVAGWRTGRLVYDGQPLATVAADLGRYYGIRVVVAPAISQRSVQATLTLSPKADPALLAPLLDVHIRAEGKGWSLSPRS